MAASLLHCGPCLSSRPQLSSSGGRKWVRRRLTTGLAAATTTFGLLLSPGTAMAADTTTWLQQFLDSEPKNALSLPTWTIHVASVLEWMVAMQLVWQYGDYEGNQAWKGLSWGMVPLLGGALCACTWHFFYNAESLEILVVLQATLTLIGNTTLWIAAFRIFQAQKK